MKIRKLHDKWFPECNEDRLEEYKDRKEQYINARRNIDNVKPWFPIDIFYDDTVRIKNEK
ncbi:MAG TPA: hypothetical protein ACHBX6_02085 [Arsenophonus nasoniae]|uniref:hypothetical protein n=1 Tax=Arsenophonus nasoniae TaxID=638 RepID=UPI0038791EDA